MESVVKRISFGCALQLPSVKLEANTLERLMPGDVVRLAAAAGAPAEWRVAGQPLALAQAMRRGSFRAARIERNLSESAE
jgi:flagellar motor switch protein FliM